VKVVVFGANGPTGRLLIEQALAAGHEVVAATRRPDEIPPRERLVVCKADVADPEAVDAAIVGTDAVASVLGVPFSRRPIDTYSLGTHHVITAMHRHGLSRLIVTSSSVLDPRWHPRGSFFYNRILVPLGLGRNLYADLRRMEELASATDLEWTVVRPSGLFDLPEPTEYELAEGSADGQYTARADLAAAIVAQLADDRFVRKHVGVITTAEHPSLRQLFKLWTQPFRKD
jgi:putative NADH-flavin reductase